MKYSIFSLTMLLINLTILTVFAVNGSYAEDAAMNGPQSGEEFVSQQSLKEQVLLAKQRLENAQSKLTALSGCHAQHMLYVMRNGVAQCWNPVATFPN